MKDNAKLIALTILGLGLALYDNSLRNVKETQLVQYVSPAKVAAKKVKKKMSAEEYKEKIQNDINSSIIKYSSVTGKVADTLSQPLFNAEKYFDRSNDAPIDILDQSVKIVKNLSECIPKEICGLAKELKDNPSGYHNPYQTPIHDTVLNALELIDVVSQKEEGLDIPSEVLVKAMSIQHGRIPTLALDIMLDQEPSSIPFEEVQMAGLRLSGQPKGKFFAKLADSQIHILATSEQYESFKSAYAGVLSDRLDPEAGYIAKSSLSNMEMSDQEFLANHKSTCHLIENEQETSVKNRFFEEMSKQASYRNLQINPITLCNE